MGKKLILPSGKYKIFSFEYSEKTYDQMFDEKFEEIKNQIAEKGITSNIDWKEFINMDKMIDNFEKDVIEKKYSDREDLDEYYEYFASDPFREIEKLYALKRDLDSFLSSFIEDDLIKEYLYKTFSISMKEIWDSDIELRRNFLKTLFESKFLDETFDINDLIKRKWEELPLKIRVFLIAIEKDYIE